MRSEPLHEAREDEGKLWRAVRPRSQFSLASVFCLLVVACFADESEFTESPSRSLLSRSSSDEGHQNLGSDAHEGCRDAGFVEKSW